jgi:hypothetical protein
MIGQHFSIMRKSIRCCLVQPQFANEGSTCDQHDAFSIAAWLSRADRDGSLATLLKPELSPRECTLVQECCFLSSARPTSVGTRPIIPTARFRRYELVSVCATPE